MATQGINNYPQTIQNLLFIFYHGLILIGGLKILLILFKLFGPCFRIPKNIYKRYNGGWAVITGATDGIGYAFCQQLAKKNFNICLISRTKSKLQECSQKLKKINPNIETRIVVANFQNSWQQKFFQNIYNQIKDLDVSILVNNVGYFNADFFSLIPIKQIQKEATINTAPLAMLTHYMLPNLLKRQKSAIINMASSSSVNIFLGSANYIGGKTFDDYMSRSLSYQYKKKIDFLSVRPFLVSTPMTRNLKNFMFISPNYCVKACLGQLGHTETTFGPFIHRLQGVFTEEIYFEWKVYIISFFFLKTLDEYKKIDQAVLKKSKEKNKKEQQKQ